MTNHQIGMDDFDEYMGLDGYYSLPQCMPPMYGENHPQVYGYPVQNMNEWSEVGGTQMINNDPLPQPASENINAPDPAEPERGPEVNIPAQEKESPTRSGSYSGENIAENSRRNGRIGKKRRRSNASQQARAQGEQRNLKNMGDKVQRRKVNAKAEDLVYIIEKLCPGTTKEENWPVRPKLQDIQKMITEIKEETVKMQKQGKNENEINNEMKNKLEKVDQEIQQYDYKDRENQVQLHAVVEKIRQFIRETANIGSTSTDQGQGIGWQTRDPSVQKYTAKTVLLLELQNELFFANKKKVLLSSFPGLQEQYLELEPGAVPEYLQDIASKIKIASGIAETDENKSRCHNTLLLFYAAVHEMMKCVGINQLQWDKLLTWAAASNKARDDGFQVTFFEQHLKKVLYAYCFEHSDDIEERTRKLKDQLITVMKDCQSAEEYSFEGKSLINGLFPQ